MIWNNFVPNFTCITLHTFKSSIIPLKSMVRFCASQYLYCLTLEYPQLLKIPKWLPKKFKEMYYFSCSSKRNIINWTNNRPNTMKVTEKAKWAKYDSLSEHLITPCWAWCVHAVVSQHLLTEVCTQSDCPCPPNGLNTLHLNNKEYYL